ncbi:MAG: hypothetical protein HQK76_20660 [Desulfobacterales bacterium]|nr:hypothetical protein [Desulfobacterales bacterium]
MRKKALKRLGFTEEWLKHGIITEDRLLQLYNEIQSSEDKNAEHYRAYAFNEFIKAKKSLSDSEIDISYSLKDEGPDLCDLHENRIIEILYSNLLTDEQLEGLSKKYPEIDERPFQILYRRLLAIRRIEKYGLNGDTFDQVKLSADAEVHLYSLNRKDIKIEQLDWLIENGNNKKVRNIAGVVLKRLRKRTEKIERAEGTREPRENESIQQSRDKKFYRKDTG